ncbi:hypothetical protein BJX99DRAFT_228404 [Aspergillus californicus]
MVATACDPCRRRKVRCNSQSRCQQCEHLNLRCTYTHNHDARSRKNAARRGTLISEYRATVPSPKSTKKADVKGVGPASPPDLSLPLSTMYLDNLIPKYMAYVYPFHPIMTEKEIRESIRQIDSDRDHAAFVFAFTGITIDLTQSNVAASHVSEQITELARRAIELRTPLLPGSRPSILRAVTSIYIQMCYMSLGQYDLGFFYLREAISMVHLLRIEDDKGPMMTSLDLSERSRRQRLYWLCFVHERFMSIFHFSPATLSPHAAFPEDDPALGPYISHGWTQVIKTFLLLEPAFLDLWIGDRSQVTVDWVEQKHRELDDELWELEVSMLTELQQADLIVTRQWMRTLLWQMAMSNCLLSSNASCPSLSLEMPLRLSDQLRKFLTKISQNTIQVHGSSILSKLLEILNTIADVVIHGSLVTLEETTSRIDDIVFMKDVIFSFRNFQLQVVSRKILVEKMEVIRERFSHVEGASRLGWEGLTP